MVRYLAAFAATLSEFGRVSAPPDLPRIDIAAEIVRMADTLRDHLPSGRAFWSVIGSLPKSSPVRRLCHGDLNAKNLLLTSTRSVMLVDWEWAAMAEPAYEFKNTRATAERGYRELRRVREYYEVLTGTRIPAGRLLLADIHYGLVQLQLARTRGLTDWQTFQRRRVVRLVGRYRRSV